MEIKHIMLPPSARDFKDIYVVFELMETDLHQVGSLCTRAEEALPSSHPPLTGLACCLLTSFAGRSWSLCGSLPAFRSHSRC